MTDPTPTPDTAALPQVVIDEAWSEFLYPRAAVDELSRPSPHSGFTRAVRVFQKWGEQWEARSLPFDARDRIERILREEYGNLGAGSAAHRIMQALTRENS